MIINNLLEKNINQGAWEWITRWTLERTILYSSPEANINFGMKVNSDDEGLRFNCYSTLLIE